MEDCEESVIENHRTHLITNYFWDLLMHGTYQTITKVEPDPRS